MKFHQGKILKRRIGKNEKSERHQISTGGSTLSGLFRVVLFVVVRFVVLL